MLKVVMHYLPEVEMQQGTRKEQSIALKHDRKRATTTQCGPGHVFL